MEKDKWISNKISILKKEGKSIEQALATAFSMWENRHKSQAGGFTDSYKKPLGAPTTYNPAQDFPAYQANFNPLNNPFQQSFGYQLPQEQGNNLPSQQYMPTTEADFEINPSQIVSPNYQEPLGNYLTQVDNQQMTSGADINTVKQDAQKALDSYQNSNTQTNNQNDNQIYNPQMFNPYGGISLEQSLNYAGQGFAEKDGRKAALGTGLSFLKGARTFLGGYGYGAQNKRVNDEARYNLYDREPSYNMQEGGTTYSQLTPEQLQRFNEVQRENNNVEFTQEGADRLFGTENMRPYDAPITLDLGKYKDLNYFNITQQGGEFNVRPTKRNPHNPDSYPSLIEYLQQQNPQAKFARQNYVPMPDRNYQEGGEITNAQYLTGQYIADEQNPNVEIEQGEHTRNSETGQIQEAIGEKHDEGGVDVNLPDGSQVLSDYTQIGKENAKKFREEFGINVKATDTFAQVMDKVNKKIGLDKIVKEESENIEELEKQMKSDGQSKTSELNTEYLQKELERAQAEKEALKPEQDRAFEMIFAEQEKIPKKGDTTKKYGGEIKALAKKYGVELSKVEALMQEGGITKQNFQEGGEYRGLEELKETARRLGYEGNYDFSLSGEKTNEDLRKMQAFIAQKDPQMVIDYFAKSGQAITADGVDIIKKTSPETFKKAGIEVPKNSADLTEDERRKLQKAYVEEGKATDEFWTTQFVDGRFAWRAPQKAAQTDFTINPQTGAKIEASLPPRMYQGEQEAQAIQQDLQEQQQSNPIDKQRNRQGSVNSFMPQDFLLPPNAMQSVFKAQADLGRLTPNKISPEASLAEIESQRQAASAQLSDLPEAQRAAALASMLGTTQGAANSAIMQTELANQADAAKIQQYNTQVSDKEMLLNQQFNQDYEQKIFAAQNNTDRDLRQYFSDLNDQNRYNYNYIDRRNLFNQAPYNYKYDGQQLVFNNESILPQQAENPFGAEYQAWVNTLTPEEQKAEQKRLTERYKNS